MIANGNRTCFFKCESSVFMRVRRTVPHFTFSLSGRFVNQISSVSTGFFRFFSVLFESGHISPGKPNKNADFERVSVSSTELAQGVASQQACKKK
jgi:hypothetical protein